MSRGLKGCYIFCTDPETNDYFTSLANTFIACLTDTHTEPASVTSSEIAASYPGLSLKVLERKDVQPYINSIPLVSLKIAAGGFSRSQAIEEFDWVEVPSFIRPSEGLFVAQVLGESMNRRIPNGSWCLFKANVTGSRQGKIVLVRHHDVWDDDLKAQYTLKKYSSEKSFGSDGAWEHSRILLMPESFDNKYQPIVLTTADEDSVSVIAEFVAVL
jgi:SOS-response transcriptional repressor LexA